MQSFVVLSGAPGSGKTTVGRTLAQHLDWPLLDKDDFLEPLFSERGCFSEEERQVLSRESDRLFEAAARALPRAILCSFWRHPASASESGTPSRWLRAPDIRVLEVVCRCAPRISARRFLSRSRHPGHHDQRWSKADLVSQAQEMELRLPLGIGRAIEQNTEEDLDPSFLLGAIEVWLED